MNVEFEKFTLDNGLKVVVHPDPSTQLAVVNILYNVGARDEHPDHTGFAHLFEHLMFGGSKNIPVFDKPLEMVGGTNNAFTNNDITNYYLSLPSENLETAFWLESDRMLELGFSPQSLDVQRNVVIEEFKQRYLNQPYGDVWLMLRPLAYKEHPYNWPTIGKEISHIETANLDQVKEFFYKYYRPNNAIMVVAGNVTTDQVRKLSEKWFGPIPAGDVPSRKLPVEPVQTEHRELVVERDVPSDAIYKVYHMPERMTPGYYTADLISDILSNGKSSRLYLNLIKKNKLFSEINAYITGSHDKGLLVITGKTREGVEIDEAERSIELELEKLINKPVSESELNKVKNKVEATIEFSGVNVLNRAMDLALFELFGDAALINAETDRYRKISSNDIQQLAGEMLKWSKCSTLKYLSKRN